MPSRPSALASQYIDNAKQRRSDASTAVLARLLISSDLEAEAEVDVDVELASGGFVQEAVVASKMLSTIDRLLAMVSDATNSPARVPSTTNRLC